MAHTCQNCGAVSDDPASLCSPVSEVLSCKYCGADNVSANHVCRQKLTAMQFSCNTCGKVAADATDLCNPGAIS